MPKFFWAKKTRQKKISKMKKSKDGILCYNCPASLKQRMNLPSGGKKHRNHISRKNMVHCCKEINPVNHGLK